MAQSLTAGKQNDDKPHRRLDVSGSLCPIPVVKARQAISSMVDGEVLEIIATDPLAELDLTILCQRGGHELISAETSAGLVRVRLRVRKMPGPVRSAGAD